MRKNKSYYDIEVDTEALILESGQIDAIFYLQDLKQRKLFLNAGIEPYSVEEIAKHILQYNKEDIGVDPSNRQPILLYLTSRGGDVDAGFELIDVILSSKTPVYTINLGYQYSMGFLIGLAGHKRFATKYSKVLMHDGSQLIYDSGAKVQDRMEFQRRVELRIKEYVLERSKLTEEEYDSKMRVEWYLYANEAKEKGFVDYIIGEDCDIDTII